MSDPIFQARELHESLRQKCGDLLISLAHLIEEAERGNSTDHTKALVFQRMTAVEFYVEQIVKGVAK